MALRWICTTAMVISTLQTVNAVPVASDSPKYFITFGDSYSQTGFNISGTQPAPNNILGNPPFPGWTTANGNQSNWIDNLIAVHNHSTILSYNFASGGATTDAGLIPGYEPYPQVLSLVNQVSEFTSSLSQGPWKQDNTLFGIWIGVNDVGNGWYQSNWTTLLEDVLDRYFEQTQILYDAGARSFLFLTVPPITLTPLVQQSSDAASIQAEAAAIVAYNDLLEENIKNLTSAHSDVTAWVFNTTAPFMKAINNPEAYGAANSTCDSSSGTDCLWYNNYHPGAAIHALVAEGIAGEVGSPWFCA